MGISRLNPGAELSKSPRRSTGPGLGEGLSPGAYLGGRKCGQSTCGSGGLVFAAQHGESQAPMRPGFLNDLKCSQSYPIALSPGDAHQQGAHRPLTSSLPLTRVLGTGSLGPYPVQPGVAGGPPPIRPGGTSVKMHPEQSPAILPFSISSVETMARQPSCCCP